MINRYFPLALGLALAVGTASADWFNDWDTNADNRLSEEEFDVGYEDAGVYDDWDADGDGLLTEGELGDGLYEGADIDGDGYLSDDEWDAGWLDV